MIRDSEKSRKNWDKSQEIIYEIITEKRPLTDLEKFALQAGNLHQKILATESNMERTRWGIARKIYTDEKELKKYIEKSQPQMMIEKK